MQKDLKIGLAVGSGLVGIAVIWLATRPSLTPQARLAAAPPQRARKQNLLNADAIEESVVAQSDTESSGSGRPLLDQPERMDERDLNPEASRENPISSSSPQGQPAPANPLSITENEPIKTEKFHIVRRGDTLSRIAYKYYGSASKWPKIFERNRNRISDANKLTVGIKLIIPE